MSAPFAPTPTPRDYDALWFNQTFARLASALRGARREGADIEVGDARLILRSPDGTRFQVTVADDGTLSATAL